MQRIVVDMRMFDYDTKFAFLLERENEGDAYVQASNWYPKPDWMSAVDFQGKNRPPAEQKTRTVSDMLVLIFGSVKVAEMLRSYAVTIERLNGEINSREKQDE